MDALKRGDFPTAESKLREELKSHPDNPETLSFLGAALDNQKKFAEADAAHKRALALAPRSSSVIDNYGSHLIATGDDSGARDMFARALALDAADAYANLQLAQLAIKNRKGAEALTYLNRLSAAQQALPDIAIQRVVALDLSGKQTEAGTLSAGYRTDAAWLYALAYTQETAGETREAFQTLRQAAQIAPSRPDVQKSFASAAANLGEFKDAAAAWNAYIRLEPGDDTGRRERGFADAHINQVDAGIADLRWYVGRHPSDADGYYELGVAESAKDPLDGLPSLDKAITLNPDFAAALSVRGALYYRQGKPEKALPDLERAATLEPSSALIQDRLGEVYLALDRPDDALRVFRRAAELAPNDYQAQFHLANALAEAGQTKESEAIMQRIRKWPATPDGAR